MPNLKAKRKQSAEKKKTRRTHYHAVADPSGIESSESEYELEPHASCPSAPMELDDPLPFSPTHHLANFEQAEISEDELSNADAMDVDPPGDNMSLSDSDSDGDDGGLDLDELPDVGAWKAFDEQEDQEEPITREEMERELEEMLSADEEAELWDHRERNCGSWVVMCSE
ncbi:hypothetical protein B0H19DRAFT_1071383 [Mycena capillaripes]|nr:hypothetical protein B0H19DRAFT_1071383 [Mycena capillaripes]